MRIPQCEAAVLVFNCTDQTRYHNGPAAMTDWADNDRDSEASIFRFRHYGTVLILFDIENGGIGADWGQWACSF